MISYCPAHIIAEHFGHYGASYSKKAPSDFLPLYEHLARKVLDWELPHEILEDTSAIGCFQFPSFSSQEVVRRTLAKVFLAVGTGYGCGMFLKRMRIRKWADLVKPIEVPGYQSKGSFCGSITHDVRERKLRESGPNEYHPEAVYGQTATFRFDGFDRLWHFDLCYGYSIYAETIHSSWSIGIKQRRGESLRTFVDVTAPKWLESMLEPERDPGVRTYRNLCYDRLHPAVEEVFGTDWRGNVNADLDLVNHILDGRKPILTMRRLGVIRNWMKADAEAQEKWRKEHEPKGEAE